MDLKKIMEEICGLNNFQDHNIAYESIVCELGFEEVHKLLPASDEELIEAYKEDEHLNNIPLKKWDRAAGWTVIQTANEEKIYPHWNDQLPRLFREKLGLKALSLSTCVSTLKACARMVAEGRTSNATWENHKALRLGRK